MNSTPNPLTALSGASIEEKAELIQSFYEQTIFHESGIMYSMMKIDGDIVRPFEPRDFEGIDTFNFEGWRIKPKGAWDVCQLGCDQWTTLRSSCSSFSQCSIM